MAASILIIEDEANIADVCRRYLEREGHRVDWAADGEQGLSLFRSLAPDIVILDVMLPDKDGWTVCEEMRLESDVPILMLTARGDERDRIVGLTLGADDYVTKPFSPRELILRVQNILRRSRRDAAPPENDDLLRFGDLRIDPRLRRVFVQGMLVELTVKEFDILHVMAKRPGQVFSRVQLLDLLWDSTYDRDHSAVTVQISRLREKIEHDPQNPRWIKTVWGIGYRFEYDENADAGGVEP